MSVLDKILFWRKKEEPIMSGETPPELGLPEESEVGLKPLEGFEESPAAGLAPRAAPPEMPGPMPSREPPESPSSFSARESFAPYQAPSAAPMSKDLELISAKLDALKAILDNINQRLTNLEKMAQGEHEIY